MSFAIAVLSAGLRRTSEASSVSMPSIVIDVVLRWNKVALNAPPEADAIAHWSIVAQSCGKLGEFTEELIVEP